MRRSLLLALVASLVAAAPASAGTFLPPGGVLHGVAGGSIEEFARETGRRPQVFQLFTVWGSADHQLRRADASGAEVMLHVSTNRGPGTREVITPAQIARGDGDEFLVRFGRKLAGRGRPLYLRLMAEMNGPWNPYCAFDSSAARGPATRPTRSAPRGGGSRSSCAAATARASTRGCARSSCRRSRPGADRWPRRRSRSCGSPTTRPR
jgi:hypothetical protein